MISSPYPTTHNFDKITYPNLEWEFSEGTLTRKMDP